MGLRGANDTYVDSLCAAEFFVIFFSTAWVYEGVTSDLAYALGMQPIICLWVSSSLFPNLFQGFNRAAAQALERVLPQRLLSKRKAT